jgi:copper chaperone NosL
MHATRRDGTGPRYRVAGLAVACLAAVLALACQPAPRPIAYGRDTGDYCRMTIMDERWGAELVTRTGKVYVFDSIECLASFYLEEQVAHEDVHSMWVTDFYDPPTMLTVEDAFFLHSRDLPSPMGMNLTAFSSKIRRDAVTNSFFGELLDWDGVLDLVRSERHGGAHAGMSGAMSGSGGAMPHHGPMQDDAGAAMPPGDTAGRGG